MTAASKEILFRSQDQLPSTVEIANVFNVQSDKVASIVRVHLNS